MSSYVEEHLFPYEEKCNYLLEIKITESIFYLNHTYTEMQHTSYGKYLNHSSKHLNLYLKMFEIDDKLDVIFFAKHKIMKGTELVWNYGNSFSGVRKCVESCKKCLSK